MALLRLGLLKVLRLGLELLREGELKLLDELRLGLLNELLRLGLGLDERLTEAPPPRLPPPPPGRWAIAGVTLSVKPIITITIKFLVFISLLLSCLFFCICFLMQK